MTVLLYEDNFDNIMTAIYDGWEMEQQGIEVRLDQKENYSYSFLEQAQAVETDLDKSQRLCRAVRTRVGEEAFEQVYYAAHHHDPHRGEWIWRFLQKGFVMGPAFLEDLADDRVLKILKLQRNVWKEQQHYFGFLRFYETGTPQKKILFSKVEPKINLLPLAGDHFADRFPQENWMIYDAGRKTCGIHPTGEDWYLLGGLDLSDSQLSQVLQEGYYEDLWRLFHHTIAIENRKNPRCQLTMLPKWFRRNMTEFTSVRNQAGKRSDSP